MIWFGEIKSYLCIYTTQIFSWKSREQHIFPERQPIEFFNETKENLSRILNKITVKIISPLFESLVFTFYSYLYIYL